MIILNPEGGASITNVQIKGTILFKESPFEVDSLRKFENQEVGKALLKLYDFLKEVTADEAKAYIEDKKKRAFKCKECEFATNVEIALKGHSRKHEAEKRMTDELGIEVVEEGTIEKLSDAEIETQRVQAQRKHLESMGITEEWEDDTPQRGVSM